MNSDRTYYYLQIEKIHMILTDVFRNKLKKYNKVYDIIVSGFKL
jgi:hypothetical protein